MDAKVSRIFIPPLFLCVSIEHVHRQSQESAFTPQSSACVLLQGYSPLACRTVLLIFLSHLFSSLSLLGHYLPRVLLASSSRNLTIWCACVVIMDIHSLIYHINRSKSSNNSIACKLK